MQTKNPTAMGKKIRRSLPVAKSVEATLPTQNIARIPAQEDHIKNLSIYHSSEVTSSAANFKSAISLSEPLRIETSRMFKTLVVPSGHTASRKMRSSSFSSLKAFIKPFLVTLLLGADTVFMTTP